MNLNQMFDEFGHGGAEFLDPDFIATYQQKSGFDPLPDLVLLEQHGVSDTSLLIDIGCGTGEFAIAAASVCPKVLAVDVSIPMLNYVSQKAKARGVSNIISVHGGFLGFTHAEGLADFIYTRNALHHLPDFWKVQALTRISGLLKPGGILILRDLVFSFDPAESDSFIGRWLDAAPLNPRHGWTKAELQAHLTQEYSTYSWLLESMLQRAGFEILRADHSTSKIFAVYVCKRSL